MTEKTVTFMDEVCTVKVHEYATGGRKAIQLYIQKTGEPMATATVNMPDYPLSLDEVIIKDYSENAGILDTLRASGIIGPVKQWVPVGFTTCPVCDILMDTDIEKEPQS